VNSRAEPLRFVPPRGRAAIDGRNRLARLGDWMRGRRRLIVGLQWLVLAIYVVLVAVPAFLPLPDGSAHLWDDLTLFAQFVFWGIWWPFVLLSMMLMGRVWCGVLCPEGFATEQVSRFGLGRPVPRWIKWGGWPFVAFLATTVYGQLVSVYQYPKAALLVLGGSTVAAVAVGLVYGREKRVWCRHLCPVNGVFGLLSRLSPLHFRSDRAAWEAHRGNPAEAVNCAPLVDLRRMESSAGCHMCARCSGHRGAIALEARRPGSELTRMVAADARRWEVGLLTYGLIGTAIGAFQWSASPWFVEAKLALAEWLIERNSFALLGDDAPWWLLTHYPQANDVFTWLDGGMILAYIGASALAIGGWIDLWLRLAGRLAGYAGAHLRLAYALIPLGGAGVFLGLSALTVTLLAAEGIRIDHLGAIRASLLAAATLAAVALALRMLRQDRVPSGRQAAVLAAFCCAAAAAVVPWLLMYYRW